MFSKILFVLATCIAYTNSYVINGSVPVDCWGVNTTVEVDLQSDPYPQQTLGFPTVHVTFSKNISKIRNSWHLGNKSFVNNTLTFNLVEYQSSFGGIISFENLKCINDTLGEPLTFNISMSNTPTSNTSTPTANSKPTTSNSSSPTTKKTNCR